MAFKLGSIARLGALLGGLALGSGSTGCTGGAPRPATAADAARAHTTIAELDHGRTLFMAHCGSCHVPPSPESQPVDAWPGHVDEMQTRAHLSSDEASLVKQYLVTVAAR